MHLLAGRVHVEFLITMLAMSDWKVSRGSGSDRSTVMWATGRSPIVVGGLHLRLIQHREEQEFVERGPR